jgi:hypothetical protein
MLTEFARLGGVVLAIQPRPRMVDCRPAEQVLPATARDVTVSELPQVLDELLPFDVRIPDQPHIWVHHRRLDDLDVYFLANTSLESEGAASVLIRGTGILEEWSLWSAMSPTLHQGNDGVVALHKKSHEDGVSEVVLDFAPGSSHLLAMCGSSQPAVSVEDDARRTTNDARRTCGQRSVDVGSEWNLDLGGPNALTLDRVNLRLREHDWSPPMDILDAQTAVKSSGTGTPFALRFSLDILNPVPPPVHLVLETPEAYRISINGTGVDSRSDAGWWTDISFRKLEVSQYLRSGNNEIVLSGIQRSNVELESVYLIGDFGVQSQRIGPEGVHKGLAFDRYSPSFQITRLPTQAVPHTPLDGPALELTSQGLLFFAGTAKLSQTVLVPDFTGPAFLEIVNLYAAVARIRLNGQLAGRVAWPPSRLEVTGLLRPGTSLLEIELVSTLRNLLGPHHVAGGDREITSPNTFRDKRRWTDDYILMPFGFDRVVLRHSVHCQS